MTPFVRPFSMAQALAVSLALVVPAAGAQTPPTSDLEAAQEQAQRAQKPQGPVEPPPGHVATVDGSVALERGSSSEDAVNGMPLLVGDRLRADSGKVEVMWAEGSLLNLGRYTDIDVLSKSMIRVTRGRISITIPNIPGQVVNEQLTIDAPGASVRFYSAGQYQILVTGDEEPNVQLGVTHGSAQLISDGGQMTLNDAEASEVKGGSSPSQPEHFLASVADSTYDPAPDIAVFQNAPGTGQGYASTQYLPQDLYGYEDVLSSNGSWDTVPTYGNVWFPKVSAGWRPYYNGRWSYISRYGWTWIGDDRFAWPTHYYGRWGVTNQGAWYWIPSKQWGPAWVAWSISPEYVGWCPLGWNGRPVYSFASITNGTSAAYRGQENFRGWTMVGSRNFSNHEVPKYVVERTAVLRDRPAFVSQYNSPRAPSYIVERSSSTGVRARTRTAGSTHVEGAALSRGSITTSAPAATSTTATPGTTANPYDGVTRQPEESPYDRALRVMGRRARPDGMSREDNRDAGGNDGRSTVAPVLRQDNSGTVRPPSGMSGPPGVYAPARGEPRPAGGNANGGNRGTQSQATSTTNSQSAGSGGVHRNSSGSNSSSSNNNANKSSNGSNDSGSSGKSSDANSSGSSGSSGKSSDNGSSGAVPRRRP
jgi:hypothetical protein